MNKVIDYNIYTLPEKHLKLLMANEEAHQKQLIDDESYELMRHNASKWYWPTAPCPKTCENPNIPYPWLAKNTLPFWQNYSYGRSDE